MVTLIPVVSRYFFQFQHFPLSVFGLGTLIFTGLEIAMHATLETKCVDNLLMAHPILQALFSFLQMHFLFVNSQVDADESITNIDSNFINCC